MDSPCVAAEAAHHGWAPAAHPLRTGCVMDPQLRARPGSVGAARSTPRAQRRTMVGHKLLRTLGGPIVGRRRRVHVDCETFPSPHHFPHHITWMEF
jgi:hypothetical protein